MKTALGWTLWSKPGRHSILFSGKEGEGRRGEIKEPMVEFGNNSNNNNNNKTQETKKTFLSAAKIFFCL